MKFVYVSTLLLVLVWVISVGHVLAESEPNDSIATADPITIGYAGGEVNATLTDNDNDYYMFTAVAGRTYVIETYNIQGTPGTRATGVWLYNSAGTEIANDDMGHHGSGNANARLIYTFNSGGSYYLRVRDAEFTNWTGSYSLRILPKYNEPGAGWDANNDNEPNDVLPIANQLQIGWHHAKTHQLFPHNSYVTPASDNDWYYFTTPANRTYVIETYNIQGTPGSRATGIWLYNENGSEIAADEFGNNGTGTGNARLVHTFVNAGTYFIRVKDAEFEDWTGGYSIRMMPKYGEPGDSWNLNDDFEPNDEIEIATSIHVGVESAQIHQLAPHTSYVTNNSDHDYYRFTVNIPGTYVLETFGIDATDRATGLWLYNESGSELDNDRFGSSTNGTARIEYNFFNTGTYIFLVKDAEYEAWAGSYHVRVCLETCAQNLYLPVVLRGR